MIINHHLILNSRIIKGIYGLLIILLFACTNSGATLTAPVVITQAITATPHPHFTPTIPANFTLSPASTPIYSTNPISQSQNFPLHPLWIFQTDYRMYNPPRVADHKVFIYQLGEGIFNFSLHYVAVDQATGHPLWTYEDAYPANPGDSNWAVAQEKLIIPSGYHVEAIDIATGERLWKSRDFSRWVASIAVGPNNVFVGTYDDEVIALDIASGVEQWHTNSLSLWVFYNPKTDHVVVLAWGPAVYIVDPQTGIVLSKTDMLGGPVGPCGSYPRLHQGRLYCFEFAIDAETGTVISDQSFGGVSPQIDYAPLPLLTSDTMYLSTQAGTIKGVHAKVVRQKMSLG